MKRDLRQKRHRVVLTGIISPLLLISGVLSACGPASDRVTVKLLTGLEKNPAQTNLMRALSTGPLESFSTDGFPCIQGDVRVGYKNNQTGEVSGFPVRAVTLASLSNLPPFSSAMVDVAVPEIRLEVPRNTPIDIGIVGAITTGAADTNGVCKSFEVAPNTGAFAQAIPSYSLFGSAEFPNGLSNEAVIPIQVWGTKSTVAPQTSTCPNGNCPGRKFVQVTAATYPAKIRLQYFPGKPIQYEQYLEFTGSGYHYIPKAGAIRAQVFNGGAWQDCTYNQSSSAVIPIDDLDGVGLNANCPGSPGYLIFSPLP